MRILLVTDTHGHLGGINALARDTSCEAVIHAGDFGFYDERSADLLSYRELNLRIVHSDLNDDEIRAACALPVDEKLRFVKERLPLSDLPRYLRGEARFEVPVYAVWGNHEDAVVVKKFYTGAYMVPNLHVVHERASFRLPGCHVYGVGGNLLLGQKLFHKPIAGGGGKVWTTLSQCLALIEAMADERVAGEVRILVSHVSPGKEPLVSVLGACTGASLVVSGHMGPPFTMVWDEFAVRTTLEAEQRLERCVQEICAQAEALDDEARAMACRLRASFDRCLEKRVPIGRDGMAPPWYRGMSYVNLPDFGRGHAILESDSGRIRLDTFVTAPKKHQAGRQTSHDV